MGRPTDTERRVVHLAALSIPTSLLALALSVVHQAHARAVVAATVRGDFTHDPADDCGCDRCAATRAELNERYDAMASALDDGALAWELDRATPHAGLYGAARLYRGWCVGVPSNSAVDPGEAA